MDEADEQGFVVIDEVPAVGLLHDFGPELLAQHLVTIRELIERDKNRPSVFMWSIANEPQADKAEAGPYFEKVAAEAKARDPASRPITAAIMTSANENMGKSLDVLMINRYPAWYGDAGYRQIIQGRIVDDLTAFNNKHAGKPIMISEYGADTIAGMHTVCLELNLTRTNTCNHFRNQLTCSRKTIKQNCSQNSTKASTLFDREASSSENTCGTSPTS